MSAISEGAPGPLGVTLDDAGANVAVHAPNASAIELCLFDEQDAEIARIRLPARSGDVHHGHIAGLRDGQRYGFRAHGPDAPADGHRFNARKLLVDPYALALDRPLKLHGSMFGYGEHKSDDSAPHVAKSVMTRLKPVTAHRRKYAWRDTIIYELNVKGFTANNPAVPPAMRGTFAALAHPASLAHLQALGVTTLELMPCAAWIDERHLAALGLTNYWGYNPIAFMAPDPRLAPGGWPEVRAAVAALQGARMEVIVDVVFNHTGEGDEFGPTVSMRGLDNETYYRLAGGSRYVNDSGCGNILAFDHAPVVRLAMDSLRAWARYGGVDGFRFDLATTLARPRSGFDPDASFLTALTQDPVLRELKLIAEPWDLGPGGYQLGKFPANFVEWNDRYRDNVRRFWRGDAVGVADLATRISGSQDFFSRRRPSASVNFVTAHDGFTLRDLVSYSQKHNEANGEDNRDGTNENDSWNNGAEGETDDESIVAARVRDQRNLLATLLLSRGTPMLSMGAELGQTQGGNNNAYAQDNETGWLDWAHADRALTQVCAALIGLRKSHPALRGDRFLDGAPQDATLIPDVEWLTVDGATMREAEWWDADATTLIAALYAQEDRVLVILNRGDEALFVAAPPAREGHVWRAAFDTSRDEANEQVMDRAVVAPRSVQLLVEERSPLTLPAPAPSMALLAQLAQAAGVATQWTDVDGRTHDTPRETVNLLLAQLGYPASTLHQARDSLARLSEAKDRRTLPQAHGAREGAPLALRVASQDGRLPAGLVVAREDGGEARIGLSACESEAIRWRGVDGRHNEGVMLRLPPLPVGRHVLRLDDGTECRLTVAPAHCHLPEDARSFGFSAQLYSLRRDADQGVGDFTTLAQVARASGEVGATLLAINPLHALFAQDRDCVSPYYPSDRRFLDPLYIDLNRLASTLGDVIVFDDSVAAALRAQDLVDYRAVHALKFDVLSRAFYAFMDLTRRQPDVGPVADFSRFIGEYGATLARFAFFEAISETRGGEDWRNWPQDLRDGRGAALSAFAKEHAPRIRFYQFLQWLADTQLGEAAQAARAAGVGLCRDLAIGAAPNGAESWMRAESLVSGFAIGAPPDAFSRDGQVWGLPAPDPLKMEADGGEDFAGLLRANMRHASALRIDHVMGLARLFVVPDGEKASAGTYISYPLDALLAQLALESRRGQCVVVGEDLGTLPWGYRDRLEAENILSYRVVWFERAGEGFAPPAQYPQKAMACASTHDLPTLEGLWAGADIDEKEALGHLTAEAAVEARALREIERRALVAALSARRPLDFPLDAALDTPLDDALAQAVHAYVASTPSLFAMAQLDDIAGEKISVNLPGTDRERPNWRRKLLENIDNLFASSRARAIINGLRRNKDEIPGSCDAPDQTKA